MMRWVVMTAVMVWLSGALFAATPRFNVVHQALEQGGFLVGEVAPGAKVTLNDTAIPVAEDGAFVVGFDRFQQLSNSLKVCEKSVCRVVPVKLKKRSYVVQQVKNVPQKTVEPSPEEEKQVAEDNKITAAARATALREAMASTDFTAAFRLPVKGPTSGVFGSRRTYNGQERSWHRGHDLAAPTGTPIYAPADGVVRMARMTFMSGNLVMLDHGGAVTSVYAHMSEIDVEVGQKVTAGTLLGRVGTTGRSSGPHLHWGMYWRNVPIDPILWVAATAKPTESKK